METAPDRGDFRCVHGAQNGELLLKTLNSGVAANTYLNQFFLVCVLMQFAQLSRYQLILQREYRRRKNYVSSCRKVKPAGGESSSPKPTPVSKNSSVFASGQKDRITGGFFSPSSGSTSLVSKYYLVDKESGVVSFSENTTEWGQEALANTAAKRNMHIAAAASAERERLQPFPLRTGLAKEETSTSSSKKKPRLVPECGFEVLCADSGIVPELVKKFSTIRRIALFIEQLIARDSGDHYFFACLVSEIEFYDVALMMPSIIVLIFNS